MQELEGSSELEVQPRPAGKGQGGWTKVPSRRPGIRKGAKVEAPGMVGLWPLASGFRITNAQTHGTLGPKYTLHDTPQREGAEKRNQTPLQNSGPGA